LNKLIRQIDFNDKCFSFACLMIPKFMPEIVALISIICFTLGEMLSIPFMNAIVIKRSNEFNRGQYAAGNTVAWSAAQVIGPISGFYLAGKFGYHSLWIGITVLLIFCAYGYSRNLRSF
jgi:MFS family permease